MDYGSVVTQKMTSEVGRGSKTSTLTNERQRENSSSPEDSDSSQSWAVQRKPNSVETAEARNKRLMCIFEEDYGQSGVSSTLGNSLGGGGVGVNS